MENKYILTGAGFSANFKGLLNDDLWTYIYNFVSKSNQLNLQELLHDKKNIEEVAHEVCKNGKFTPQEKECFQNAVQHSFELMHNDMIKYYKENANQIRATTHEFFTQIILNTSYVFTLNLDLFFEFYCKSFKDEFDKIDLLGNNHLNEDQLKHFEIFSPNNTDPDEQKVTKYVKLHGSLNWIRNDSAINQNQVMVFGGYKVDSIDKFPILKKYNSYFDQCLKDGGDLLIIGYSFNDDHINKIILDGVLNDKLHLHIMNKASINQLLDPEKIQNKFHGLVQQKDKRMVLEKFKNSIKTYLIADLQTIYPDKSHGESHSVKQTSLAKQLYEGFIDN